MIVILRCQKQLGVDSVQDELHTPYVLGYEKSETTVEARKCREMGAGKDIHDVDIVFILSIGEQSVNKDRINDGERWRREGKQDFYPR